MYANDFLDLEKRVSDLEQKLHGMHEIELPIQYDDESIIPTYAHTGDSGMDLRSSKDVYIKPGESAIVDVGFRAAIPEGYELQIRPRSGLSAKTKLRIPNTPGTIDSGYRDPVGVIVYNGQSSSEPSRDLHGQIITPEDYPLGTLFIRKGDRIAQAVLAKVACAKLVRVKDVTELGSNRNGGYGSTGV